VALLCRFLRRTLKEPVTKGEEPSPPIEITNYTAKLSFKTQPRAHQDKQI